MTRFSDSVALITGGGGAIGAAAAERLGHEGARLVIVDANEDRADATVSRLRAAGFEATAVVADVGEPAEAVAAIDEALALFGRLDVVFNNAGIAGRSATIPELEPADFDEVIRVNLRGVFLILRQSLRVMISGGCRGSIVNMSSSMAAWDVLSGGAAYAASKAGVIGLTRTAALNAASYGIRVNAICPGVVETSLGIPDLSRGSRDRERFADRIPLRRDATPADIAAVVAFLASDDARHVTGSALLVDGGQTLQSWSNAPAAERYPLMLEDEQRSFTQRGGSFD